MAWGDTRRGPARASRGQKVTTSAFKQKLRESGGGSIGTGIANTNANAQWKQTMGAGTPSLPTYSGIKSLGSAGVYKPTTLAGEQLQRLDETGLKTLRERATGTGPSAWANMMAGKQSVEQAEAADTAARTAASQTASARSMLARSGGLRGGAAERLAGKGAESELMARQSVFRQGMLDRANIGVEDERQRLQLLQSLPGQELSAAQYKTAMDTQNMEALNQAGQFNVGNRIGDLSNKNQFRQNIFGTQMAGYGAQQTAAGIRASAPGRPTGGTLGKWGREIGSVGTGFKNFSTNMSKPRKIF